VLNLAHNSITSTQGIAHPLLENLDLSCKTLLVYLASNVLFVLVNQITELTDLSETNLPTLTTLDCHGNALASAKNIKIPTLQKLYLVSTDFGWVC